MVLTTQQITETDLADVSALFEQFAKTHNSEFKGDEASLKKYLFEEKISKCFVCKSNGKAVGFLLFTPMLATFKSRPFIFINSVYVAEEFRGSTAFLSLISALKKYAKIINAVWIDGIISDDNPLKDSLSALGRNKSKWHYVGRSLAAR